MGTSRWAVSLLAALLVLNRPSIAAQVSLEELEKECRATTEVWETVNGSPEMVGRKIGGLCRGYLEASFEVAIGASEICIPSARPSTEFLASVFLTYLERVPDSRKEPALTGVLRSLLRAFPCKVANAPADGAAGVQPKSADGH